jgi:integrase
VTVYLAKGLKTVENLQAFKQPSTAVNVTVRKSAPREYLTEREVERLMKAAASNRWGHRDATAILIAYRHGLRASELVAVRWDDIDLATGKLHVRRAKGGAASVHPIGAKESRALRRLRREATTGPSPYIFVSERGAPLSVAGYQRRLRGRARLRGSGSWCTATCCAMAAATSSPMTARIRGQSSTPWPPQHCLDCALYRTGTP